MIRYAYNQQVAPAAPFLHVTLRRADGTAELPETPALVDTAADKTVVPWRVVEELQLAPVRTLSVTGFGGVVTSVPAFLIQAVFRTMRPVLVEVLASPGERYVLVGRDLLNTYRIVLDGPELLMEVEQL